MTARIAFGKDPPKGLQSDEYDTVALIYDQELSALGNRALFPICIGMPSGIPTQSLLRYLRQGGYQITDESVCEPATAPGGQYHPKDYPHGLRIFIDKLKRELGGVISLHVEADDLTLRPGLHFAETLRRGTYRFKQNESREWQISGYAKEYDYKDEKGNDGCDCGEAEIFNEVSDALIGKQITIHGKFSLLGKFGAYVVLDNQQEVYLVPRESFTWDGPYSEMEGKRVAVTGVLRFLHLPDAARADQTKAHPPDYFYLDAETAQLRLISH